MCRWSGSRAYRAAEQGSGCGPEGAAPAPFGGRTWCRLCCQTARSIYSLLQEWMKEVAPTSELRQWFNHDPERWEEFQRRYSAELDNNCDVWAPLAEAARHGKVGLCRGQGRAEQRAGFPPQGRSSVVMRA